MPDDATGRLRSENVQNALGAIAAWRAEPASPVPCPACGREGLAVSDQSARPYAEWYVLSCSACGLSETLQIPLSPPREA
jgi:predicted RNA-binding Zn-ribbon protein involved in translation (DUF1610 family)